MRAERVGRRGWILWLALATPAPAEPAPAPRRVDVELEEYTAMSVALVPDLGTRFSFPFALDEADESAPFTLTMTNPVFVHHREPGRNFFTVEIDPQGDQRESRYLGNLFVSVGGYNLSVSLSSSLDTREHVTDYVFSLSERARRRLVQDEIRERAGALERRYQERFDALERRAGELALSRLASALGRPPVRRAIRERGVLRADTGEVELRLDEMRRYGERLYVFHYRLRNATAAPLAVHGASLLLVDADGNARAAHGASSPLRAVPPGRRRGARFATDADAVGDERYRVELRVNTALGEVAARW